MSLWLCDHHTAQDVTDDVTLVCSELVTVAVLRAPGPVQLTLRCQGSEVLVEVEHATTAGSSSSGPDVSSPLNASPGLAVVGSVSSTWGLRHAPGSTTAWAVVTTHPPTTAGPPVCRG